MKPEYDAALAEPAHRGNSLARRIRSADRSRILQSTAEAATYRSLTSASFPHFFPLARCGCSLPRGAQAEQGSPLPIPSPADVLPPASIVRPLPDGVPQKAARPAVARKDRELPGP